MGKRVKTLNTEEALVEVFKVTLDYIRKSDESYMQFLCTRAKFLNDQIHFKEDEEPLWIFKKSHKKWQDELEELHEDLYDVYKKIEEEHQLNSEFYKKLQSS